MAWIGPDYYNPNYTCTPCNREFVSWSALSSHLINSQYHAWCQSESASESTALEFCAQSTRLSPQSATESSILITLDSVTTSTREPTDGARSVRSTATTKLGSSSIAESSTRSAASVTACLRATWDCRSMLDRRIITVWDVVVSLAVTRIWKLYVPFESLLPDHTELKNDWSFTHQHLNSSTHKPANMPCPTGCGRNFIDYSAITLHLESGTCSSGMTRHKLDQFVQSRDTNHIITNPARMIAYGDGNFYPPPPVYIATDASFNHQAQAFECYFCHRHFQALSSLNMHLASPKHSSPETKSYRCPHVECRQLYSTLSALVQHIERGNCGVRRFTQFQVAMQGFVGGTRAITAGY